MVKDTIRQLSVLVLLLLLGVLIYNLTQEQGNEEDEFKKLKNKYTNEKEGFRTKGVDSANEIYHQYTGGMPLVKDLKDKTNNDTLNLLKSNNNNNKTNSIVSTNIVSKCLDSEIILNTVGFLTLNKNKHLKLSLTETNTKSKSNVKLLEVVNPVKKMKVSRWKLVEGLVGPSYVSFYHMDNDGYLGRLSDNSLHCLDIDLTHNVEKEMTSFKLVDGLVNNKSVSLMCCPVHKENKPRLVSSDENGVLRVVKLEDIFNTNGSTNGTNLELAKSCQFNWVNVKTEKDILQNKHHILKRSADTLVEKEAFTSTSDSGRSKNKRNKRVTASFRKENELEDSEINVKELFTNNSTNNTSPTKKHITKGGNIFKEHTGVQFNNVLNIYDKSHKKELEDNVFKNIENAKIDPSVQNLLDFNEERYNIYETENKNFVEKIDNKLKFNTDKLDMNVRELNNYRIDKLAEELFALQDELDKKRGI